MCIYGGGVWVLVETSNSTLARWRLDVQDAWHVGENSFDKITVIYSMLYTSNNKQQQTTDLQYYDQIGHLLDA